MSYTYTPAVLNNNDLNVPQLPPTQHNSVLQGSSKRPLEDAGQASGSAEPPVQKRPRPLYEYQLTPTPEPEPDPSSTMPPPSEHIIQLRFQLCRFKGVYRTVRVPLTFTFAHLYRLILILFGWSGYHSHQAEVLTNAIMYASPGRTGEVKKHRYWKTPPEPNCREERDEWRDWYFKYGMFYREPAMRVAKTVRYGSWEVGPRKEDEPVNPNNPLEALWDELVVPKKRDEDVRLGDLWAPRKRDNLTGGDCRNEEIAIKFEYDLGASWEVHITVEPDKDDSYMWETNLPTNRPIVTVAKGGAPVEDAHSSNGELGGNKKKVSNMLFLPDVFERYLKGEVGSVARKTELAVFNVEEERARRQAAAQDKERRRQERQQSQANASEDDGEEYSSDEDDGSSDEE
ncbi:hypothetical protein LXA43DRAFT_1020265 [Ganoderma leucocontextum]|nr:hypothetical protein LXA43DRAFT_1020265 [Ganoderma leucocontextum]